MTIDPWPHRKRRQKKNVLRTGFLTRFAGAGQYWGFTLDGDHHAPEASALLGRA